MDSVHWSSFNSTFHGTSINSPFNFNRALLKTNSFNELATTGISFDSSVPSKSLDGNFLSTLSSAVIAASSTFVPTPSTISPFFHSIPPLSRSISSEFSSTPVTVETLELESPRSESRSLCLSPDEQEQQDAEREHGTQDMAELDLSHAGHSPRSEADSDEWSVPATNNESDTNQSTRPFLKNPSLLNIDGHVHTISAVKKEEFSDSENENENSDEETEVMKEEKEENEAVRAEEKERQLEESEVEEEQIKAPRRSKPTPKSKQQNQRTSRRGSGSCGRRAPISSAARLASQKKYDEKRRGIYRRLYTDLKEAIHAAQKISALKKEDGDEQANEAKKGKKKKKKKQKEIEDLSTRELLLLATNTIQLLQKQKSELDRDLLNSGVDDEEETNMKEEKVLEKKRKRNSKSERTMKPVKRAHIANAKVESQPPLERSWTESDPSSACSSHALPLPLMPALNISDMFNSFALSHQPASTSSPVAPSLWASFNNTAGTVKVENASHSASSAPPLLGSSNNSSTSSPDELKRRAVFRFIFFHLRSLFLSSSSSLISFLHSFPASNIWRNTLVCLLHSNWNDEEIAAMTFEKIFVKAAEVIEALQWLLQEMEEFARKMDGTKMEDWQLKEEWKTVASVKKEMEEFCSVNSTDE